MTVADVTMLLPSLIFIIEETPVFMLSGIHSCGLIDPVIEF